MGGVVRPPRSSKMPRGFQFTMYLVWSGVSGTLGQLCERSFCCQSLLSSSRAASPMKPRSTRKQPTTVPVRPMPARQWM